MKISSKPTPSGQLRVSIIRSFWRTMTLSSGVRVPSRMCVTSTSMTARVQACLTVRVGGLGLNSTMQLAPSAFLASAAACANLSGHLFDPVVEDTQPPTIRALEAWKSTIPLDTPDHRSAESLRRPGLQVQTLGLAGIVFSHRSRSTELPGGPSSRLLARCHPCQLPRFKADEFAVPDLGCLTSRM